MTTKIKLGEQINCVFKAVGIVSGIEKPPQIAREREYLAAGLEATVTTLRWLRDNEDAIRAAVAAGAIGNDRGAE